MPHVHVLYKDMLVVHHSFIHSIAVLSWFCYLILHYIQVQLHWTLHGGSTGSKFRWIELSLTTHRELLLWILSCDGRIQMETLGVSPQNLSTPTRLDTVEASFWLLSHRLRSPKEEQGNALIYCMGDETVVTNFTNHFNPPPHTIFEWA